jgi:hypothetical protein
MEKGKPLALSEIKPKFLGHSARNLVVVPAELSPPIYNSYAFIIYLKII